MLQVAFIRENRATVLEGLAKRNLKNAEEIVNKTILADEERRATQAELDILSGAFFRQCKWISISGGVVYVEIDGGSTSWSTIVINGTTFTRTNMTKDVDLWTQTASNNLPAINAGNTVTVTFNP